MQNRSPATVFLLSLITFGIYAIYWQVKTKGELVKQGADIPTAWLIIVPIANLYWIWKYSLGVEKVSGGKITAVLTLILLLLLSIVGIAILQGEYNKLGTAPTPPAPPVDSAPPTNPAPPAPPEAPSAPPTV